MGRYTITSDLTLIEERFQVTMRSLVYKPRYNVALTQEVLAVAKNGERRAQFMRWGLIPF